MTWTGGGQAHSPLSADCPARLRGASVVARSQADRVSPCSSTDDDGSIERLDRDAAVMQTRFVNMDLSERRNILSRSR